MTTRIHHAFPLSTSGEGVLYFMVALAIDEPGLNDAPRTALLAF
jgi:hypothetical protein